MTDGKKAKEGPSLLSNPLMHSLHGVWGSDNENHQQFGGSSEEDVTSWLRQASCFADDEQIHMMREPK